MQILRLTWKRKRDQHQQGSVIGSPEAIRDLYWQLTHNYQPVDGTAIGTIEIRSLDGRKVDYKDLMTHPDGEVFPHDYFD